MEPMVFSGERTSIQHTKSELPQLALLFWLCDLSINLLVMGSISKQAQILFPNTNLLLSVSSSLRKPLQEVLQVFRICPCNAVKAHCSNLWYWLCLKLLLKHFSVTCFVWLRQIWRYDTSEFQLLCIKVIKRLNLEPFCIPEKSNMLRSLQNKTPTTRLFIPERTNGRPIERLPKSVASSIVSLPRSRTQLLFLDRWPIVPSRKQGEFNEFNCAQLSNSTKKIWDLEFEALPAPGHTTLRSRIRRCSQGSSDRPAGDQDQKGMEPWFEQLKQGFLSETFGHATFHF